MIRVGDKVVPILTMSKKGVVVEIFEVKSKKWMVGGTVSASMMARVLHEATSEVLNYPVSDLMRLD